VQSAVSQYTVLPGSQRAGATEKQQHLEIGSLCRGSVRHIGRKCVTSCATWSETLSNPQGWMGTAHESYRIAYAADRHAHNHRSRASVLSGSSRFRPRAVPIPSAKARCDSVAAEHPSHARHSVQHGQVFCNVRHGMPHTECYLDAALLRNRIGGAFDANDFKLALELSTAAVTLAGQAQPYLTVSRIPACDAPTRSAAAQRSCGRPCSVCLCVQAIVRCSAPMRRMHRLSVGNMIICRSASLMPAPFTRSRRRAGRSVATPRCTHNVILCCHMLRPCCAPCCTV
jgi:hypothetical protein